MRVPHASMPVRTLLGGAVCLAILAGMMVGHAWPLWTGETVLLRVRPVDPRDLFRGEYVRLDTPAAHLFVVDGPRSAPAGAVPVQGLGAWQRHATDTKYIGGRGTAYVQLERRPTGEHEAVSISDVPVKHAMNLRGEVRVSDADGNVFIDYGLDAFYMQEGTAKPVQDALAAGRTVQMQVAIAPSGRSRIRTVLVEGLPVR